MAKLYFKYGNGKSADLCMVNYNYRENNGKTVIINADGSDYVISSAETGGKRVLELETNDKISNEMFHKGFSYKVEGISIILIDNADLLTAKQVNELYYITKVFDIDVVCYGTRNTKSDGIIRLLELSSSITQVDGYNQQEHALLEFYYGAMNCSKTAKLLFKSRELEVLGKKVLVAKPLLDRDEFKVKSRIGLERKADIVVYEDTNIYDEIVNYPLKLDYILVDEGQFLSKKNVTDLYRITRDVNIPCRVYGLKSDFQTRLFEGSKRLLSSSDNLIKLDTVCSCKNNPEAEFNARLNNDGVFTYEGSQCVIDDGSSYKYVSLCGDCYLKNVFHVDTSDPAKFVKKMGKIKF